MEWNNGYCTDITYTYGYYGDFNPVNIRFCLLLAGLASPEIENACELGYGQGVSLNIHAAAEPIAWYGTDFNPSQAVFARSMAEASGAKAHCYADSFHDFVNHPDLPEFDYIALHGIWSWVSPEVQKDIVKFIDKKLKIGGVLYISYNTQPGWASFQPARELMMQYANSVESGSPVVKKVEEAFGFLQKLNKSGAAYFKQNPGAASRLDRLQQAAQRYLAHELFNEYWQPCLFKEMAAVLSEARLTFATSALPVHAIAGGALPTAQKEILAKIADPLLRQSAYDFLLNTQFRKDIWVKGPKPLSILERNELARNEPFVLITAPRQLQPQIKTTLGEVTLTDATMEVFRSVLGDGKIHTIGDMEKAARALARSANPPKGIEAVNLGSLLQNMAVLQSGGVASSCQSKKARQASQSTAENLNNFILRSALSSDDIGFLASPVTGGGIASNRFEQLFILALQQGAKTTSEIAAFTQSSLQKIGVSVLHEGKKLEENEVWHHIEEKVNVFIENTLPIYKTLQLC